MNLRRLTVLFFVLLFALGSLSLTVGAGSIFQDVEDDAEYAWAAKMMKEMGLFLGDDAGNFNPHSGITRAEFATVICRMLGGEDEACNPSASEFQDVPLSHWACGYISWAVDHGIINGYGNGNYGPSDPVTYEQAIKMVMEAVDYGELAADAGGWPYGYIAIAEEIGALTGVEKTFGFPMTRANAAVFISNVNIAT